MVESIDLFGLAWFHLSMCVLLFLQGGNWNHLQAMLDIEAGEEILYVGDHLYADVLRSKRALGWRSCFIMPELPEEMRIFQKQLKLRNSIMELRKLRDEFSQYKDMLTRDLESGEWERLFSQIEEDDFMVKQKLSDASLEYHSAFHPRWGQMFVVSINLPDVLAMLRSFLFFIVSITP
jgi:hypothetical protein